MQSPENILADARHTEPDPPRSKLDDYAEVIWELRRKRKRIRTIAAFFNEHGVPVSKSTVARWIKRHPPPKAETAVVTSPTSPSQHIAREFFTTPHEPKRRPYQIE